MSPSSSSDCSSAPEADLASFLELDVLASTLRGAGESFDFLRFFGVTITSIASSITFRFEGLTVSVLGTGSMEVGAGRVAGSCGRRGTAEGLAYIMNMYS